MNWLQEHRKGLVNLQQLENRGLLKTDPKKLKGVEDALSIRVPQTFLEKNGSEENGLENQEKWENLSPELLNQVIPLENELNVLQEELLDPISDEAFSPLVGITHRYADRVLLKPTYHCGMYCRFCFRRYKVSKPNLELSSKNLSDCFDYISMHPEICEVILTGGDPLTLSNKKIFHILQTLDEIPHVKCIRLHTRCLSAFPKRICSEFLSEIAQIKTQIWFVSHINSHKEWNEETIRALASLRKTGMSLAAQTVVLRGVNNCSIKLKQLFLMLYENGIVPYYLHYPDLAQGTNHFRIPLSESIEMLRSLRGNTPGLALPNLVVDIPGGHGKILADSASAKLVSKQLSQETWEFESPISKKWIEVRYPSCENETYESSLF
jgi:lysine 2,3-aminomutase